MVSGISAMARQSRKGDKTAEWLQAPQCGPGVSPGLLRHDRFDILVIELRPRGIALAFIRPEVQLSLDRRGELVRLAQPDRSSPETLRVLRAIRRPPETHPRRFVGSVLFNLALDLANRSHSVPAIPADQKIAKVGLEPTRPEGHKILSLARLPIPPLGRVFSNLTGETKVKRVKNRSIPQRFTNYFRDFESQE